VLLSIGLSSTALLLGKRRLRMGRRAAAAIAASAAILAVVGTSPHNSSDGNASGDGSAGDGNASGWLEFISCSSSASIRWQL